MKRVLRAVVALGTFIGGCYGTPSTEQEVAVTEQEVQTDYLSVFVKRYMEAVTGNAVNSTASVHTAWPNLNPPTGTGAASCGATFVSKHFAITAAHCVEKKGPLNSDPLIQPGVDTFELRQYDTRNLNWWQALNTSVVSGSWPNWTRGTTLTTNDGYLVRSDTCNVKLRCGVSPTSKCPAGVTGDIALVHCPNRPTNLGWAPVAGSEAGLGAAIEILWFHELLALPSAGTAGDQFWDHYGNKVDPDGAGPVTAHANNWHYRAGHQLLPFRSTSWDDSTPYKVTAAASGNVTWTDAFGCHGTSGSGIFQAGTTLLLGPTVNPGNAFFTQGQDLLCADMDDASVAPGQRIVSYTRQSMTRQIEQINIPGEGTVVLNDR